MSSGAGSTGQRNTGVKFLCRGFKSQGLAWPLIELAGHFVEMGLRVHRQVGSFRKILSQQAIGVLIGTALPRTGAIVFPRLPSRKLLPAAVFSNGPRVGEITRASRVVTA